MKVIIDSREQKKMVYVEFLQTQFPKHEFEIRKLDEGDFAVCGRVRVERKDVADLFQSLITHRMKDQASRIAEHEDEITFVMVTGNMERFLEAIDEVEINMSRDQIASIMYGGLASIACRERIHIAWMDNIYDALTSMVRFMECVERGEYMVPLKRDPNKLFARFLGITPSQYAQIKLMWPNLREFMNECTDDGVVDKLCSIRGVGTVKASLIRNLALRSWHLWK